jgi:Aldehyde dehydrogenase family
MSGDLPPSSRVTRLADLVERHFDELSMLDTLDMGAPISRTTGTRRRVPGMLRYYAGMATSLHGETIENSLPGACHNAIWELAERLVASGQNPDHLGTDAIAAELTNRLIPGIVLTPGAVATLVELQRAGFTYCR